MTKCANYIADGKEVLGNPRMADRELGERLAPFNHQQPFSQQNIARSKVYMTDPVAIALGKLLKKHRRIEHAGEVLMVARAEREKDEPQRSLLLECAGKLLSLTAEKAISGVAALMVSWGLLLSPQPAEAAFGGSGRFRPRRA